MSQSNDSKWIDSAIRKSLNRSEEWAVPEPVKAGFLNHFIQFPHDDRFVVDLNDSMMTCIEEACYVDVPIVVNPSGGVDLSNYAQHILNSEYSQGHVNNRNQRIKQNKTPRPSATVKKEQTPPNSFNKIDVVDLTDDTKPVIFHSNESTSSKRPLTTSSGSTTPNKKLKTDDQQDTPELTRLKQELAQLDNKEARIQAQYRHLAATPPHARNATFFTNLQQFKTILAAIPAQRVHYQYLIQHFHHDSTSSAPPAPFPAPIPAPAPAPAPVAGPGPRTTELQAKNPALAAAADKVRQLEEDRRAAQDAAIRAYGQLPPAPGVAGHAYPRGAADDAEWGDPDYPDEIRRFDQQIERGNAEFNEFLTKAAADDMFDHNQTVETAAAKIGLTREKPTPPDMMCNLMPHQLMGVAWMVEQEKSESFGGILGDEMGLGKTVQTIATMTLNESSDMTEKTTLIVAPLALLKQWEREIQDKCRPGHYSILIYHGQNKKDIRKVKHLLKYDIVITTYQTVVLEWSDEEGVIARAKKEAKKKKDNDNWENYVDFSKKSGFLFKANFYRIILDESQMIRNKATKVSRAVAQLDGLLRWCLTGTPITNKLEDLFPALRFLQIKPWYNWEEFRNRCMLGEKRADQAAARLQVIIRPHLFRRKKDSTIDGKPILQLPERTVELQLLEFSEEERSIYTAVETQSQIQFNKYLKAGTVLKNYAHVLVMLLRLRQVAFHPALLGEAFDEMHAEREKQEELARAVAICGQGWVDKLIKTRFDLALERAVAERDKTDAPELDDCPICLEPATANEGGAQITKCRHVFCKECIQDVLQGDAQEEAEEDGYTAGSDERPCPSCRTPISHRDLFNLATFEPESDDVERVAKGDRLGVKYEKEDDDPTLGGFIVDDNASDLDEEPGKGKGKAKAKAKAKAPKQPNRAVIQDSDDDIVCISSSDDDVKPTTSSKGKAKGGLVERPKLSQKMSAKDRARAEAKWRADQEPSTKMVWVLKEINRIRTEAPDDKVIVSCSFVTALDMMEDYLVGQGIRVVRFQGDMTMAERDTSVQILQKSKKCFVMLMSLKSGGVGLNLVRANRWISLDLAWSFAVEEQAFARIHRIGQDKEVRVDRLTIATSVEQRIGALQEHKQKIADASLGEGTGAKIGRLSVAQLAGLFGLTEDGERIADVGRDEE